MLQFLCSLNYIFSEWEFQWEGFAPCLLRSQITVSQFARSFETQEILEVNRTFLHGIHSIFQLLYIYIFCSVYVKSVWEVENPYVNNLGLWVNCI